MSRKPKSSIPEFMRKRRIGTKTTRGELEQMREHYGPKAEEETKVKEWSYKPHLWTLEHKAQSEGDKTAEGIINGIRHSLLSYRRSDKTDSQLAKDVFQDAYFETYANSFNRRRERLGEKVIPKDILKDFLLSRIKRKDHKMYELLIGMRKIY